MKRRKKRKGRALARRFGHARTYPGVLGRHVRVRSGRWAKLTGRVVAKLNPGIWKIAFDDPMKAGPFGVFPTSSLVVVR